MAALTVTSVVAGGVTFAAGTATGQTGSGDVLYRVNAGGGTVTASSGPDWVADASGSQYSSGGSSYTASDLSAGDVTNPTEAPSSVFLTERYGDHSYAFDVTAGESYEVRLYVAEIYHGVSTSSADAGDRVFDVSVEESQVLDDYDVVAETAGAATATVETFEVTPSDGTLDVSLSTVEDNAKVSAIEVVDAAPEPGVVSGPSGVDFGTTVVDGSTTRTVTLTNEGEGSDVASITVDGVSVTGANAGDFSADLSGTVTLAPGETTDVPVTFTPSQAEARSATLEVGHDAPNTSSPLTVALSGTGTSSVPVDFGHGELQGFSTGNPTSLDWGPDGRLYVSNQDGQLFALTVERNGEDDYSVTDTETIELIQDIPNHDDDGSFGGPDDERQVTGLRVGGTADQPVVYVTSSDPRISVGNDNPPENSLDTNSGTLSRLTRQGDGGWDHDLLVRGLPRSEENHATNGVAIADDGDTIYLAQGGHTNQGAPGDKLSYLPEYALSAAVLQVDVARIESDNQPQDALDEDGNAYAEYYYDIPTLNPDQSNAPNGGPFGGLDGRNMGKLVQGGPVQVYSPGYRNPYDVVIRPNGDLYTVDNGHNGGWGDQPVGEATNQCTNEINDGGGGGANPLHHIDEEGYYGGHANPTRANPDGANVYAGGFRDDAGELLVDFSQNSPVEADANPVECDWQAPGNDGALTTFGTSTNGLGVYTADNFGGALDGALLAASFDGNAYYTTFNGDGSQVEEVEPQFSTGLNTPLDVTAMDDGEAYPGTVWVADFGGNDVDVYEPDDFEQTDGDGSGTGDQCVADDPSASGYDPDGDADGDGYTNADENDVGTDPCSASSTPGDFDGDGVSNLNDPDDDDDGTPDTTDPFAIDPDDGTTTTAPVEYTFNRGEVPGTILDLGFTGLMTNGSDYRSLYDESNVIAGAAAPVLTIEDVPPGDAVGDTDDQRYAFQSGVNVTDEPLTVHTTLEAPFGTEPTNFQSQGLYVGTGDQDNYVKLVTSANGGTGGVQFAKETGGTFSSLNNPDVPAVVGSKTVDLYLDVYPGNDTAVARYEITGSDIDGTVNETVGNTSVPSSWLDSSDQGLAFGVVSTSYQSGTFGSDSPYTATYVQLEAVPLGQTDADPNQAPNASFTAAPTAPTVGEQVTFDAAGSSDGDGSIASYAWDFDGDGQTDATGQTATTTFDSAGDETVTLTVTDDAGATATATGTVSVESSSTATEVLYRVNAGESTTVPATDDGPGWTGVANTSSQFLASVADGGSSVQGNYAGGDDVTKAGDLPASVPEAIFDAERYGNMTWAFDVAAGSTVEVRLYHSNQFPGTDGVGDRQFDASIEGEQVLTQYDPVADVGDDTGTVKAYTVTEDGDGTVSITYTTGTAENPQVNAIEIVTVGDDVGDDTDNTSAEVTLTPGAGIAASTYESGSYTVTNTGETNVTTLRVDLNETLLPDMVHDPFNTAGDDVGKEFTLDSGDVTVQDVSYTNVHNGVDNDQGYDSVVVTLSGFEPGESMSFSLDNDPTSIDSTDLGSQAAGPVSGLELFGGTVAVGDGSGDLIEATIVGDGSAGGAQATVTNEGDESAPTIDVAGTTLSNTTLSDRHTAATVTNASQTITITGAPANATVTLLRGEAELNLTDVPNPVEIEAYEGNKLVDVTYQTVQTDANGTATVDVTLTNSTATGGQNYLAASVEESDGDTGPASNYVVLDLVDDAAPTIGSITDQGVTEGGSITVDANASDADGDALTYSVDGPDFVTAANGTVEVAPGDGTVGTYDVTVTVSDGAATVSESFAVYVDEPDRDGNVALAVNAGGGNYTAADGTPYLAGSQSDALAGGPTYSTGQAVANTEDDALYQTERYGGSSGDVAPNLSVPVENGTYEVTLQFAEIFQGVSGNDAPDSTTPPTDGTDENDRLFDVAVEGETVLDGYDVYSEVGPTTATDKRYTVEVTDGELNVTFEAVNDNAKLSAIRVEALDATDGPDDAGPGPVGDFESAPTDPDGDGVYEDVNGDGSVTGSDITALFANVGDETVQNSPAGFDYNGDGDVTGSDVTALFAEIDPDGDGN